MNDRLGEMHPPAESGGGALSTMANAITDVVVGSTIPAPIRQNALKAFGQLCSAAVDIPVAHLEGIAAEKRAETEARKKLIAVGAEQMAQQMKLASGYADIAAHKFGQKIVREQINLDKVVEIAANQIIEDTQSSHTPKNENNGTDQPTIDENWTNNFESHARNASSDELRLTFGRILAGEIQRPSSFSIRTVKLLADIDQSIASSFQRLCSMCISLELTHLIIDARVMSFAGNAATNALGRYGLGFDVLNSLNEYGLIIADYNSNVDYSMSIVNENRSVDLPFTYGNEKWAFTPRAGDSPKNLRVDGVALTNSGKELFKVIDKLPVEDYKSALWSHLNAVGFDIVKVIVQ